MPFAFTSEGDGTPAGEDVIGFCDVLLLTIMLTGALPNFGRSGLPVTRLSGATSIVSINRNATHGEWQAG